MHTIYRIVCFRSFKVYIGQTQTKYERNRFRNHFSMLRDNKHHSVKLQADYNLYGRDAFYLEVLERGIPDGQINGLESHYITHFDSFQNGYNGNTGDKSKPCVWNSIQYRSMSAAAMANAYDDGDMRYFVSRGYKCDDDIPNDSRRHKRRYLLERLERLAA